MFTYGLSDLWLLVGSLVVVNMTGICFKYWRTSQVWTEITFIRFAALNISHSIVLLIFFLRFVMGLVSLCLWSSVYCFVDRYLSFCPFFCLSLRCLSFDLGTLITTLVSSISSWYLRHRTSARLPTSTWSFKISV